MIKYTPSSQLTLEAFKHPFTKELKKDNRWIKLAELVPWDNLAGIYAKNLDTDAGRLSIDIRMIIRALIIKHKLKLSDRDTVDMISESLYMQYFCGLKGFQSDSPFDPSFESSGDVRLFFGFIYFKGFSVDFAACSCIQNDSG